MNWKSIVLVLFLLFAAGSVKAQLDDFPVFELIPDTTYTPKIINEIDKCQPIRDMLNTIQSKYIDHGQFNKALTTLQELLKEPEFEGCSDLLLIEDKIAYINGLIFLRDSRCPDNNHPHAIDLGMPSGTKWACCNVGASKPEGYGNYYAWGETSTKSSYDWSNYEHCDGSSDNCHNLGSSICGTQYDVAHVKWGKTWRMPTLEQCKELLDKCKSEWTKINGVNGRRFTGPNGASIFLPAAGYCLGSSPMGDSGSGYYWSGTHSTTGSYSAYKLYFGTSDIWNSSYGRRFGQSVRPVAR